MMRITKEEFVIKSNEIHNNKYDYSKVEYINSRTKVCIICPTHGEFWQTPHIHLGGHGCPECGKEAKSKKLKLTLTDFKNGILKHHPEYNLSLIKEYKGRDEIVTPICPIHGDFNINARSLYRGHGCPKCGRETVMQSNIKSNEDFINDAINVHGKKYVYSKVEYVNSNRKVKIICPKHGEFWQIPSNHLQGCGCPKCASTYGYSTKEWVQYAMNVHKNDKYDYSKVYYINNSIKVCIICPKHGEFWQLPKDHLRGFGCYLCGESKAEKEITDLLQNRNIKFTKQQKFAWLNRQSLDFYLPEYNVAIECQGLQHFKPIEYFGGINSYTNLIERDKRKMKLCEENRIKLLYYANYNYEFPYKVYTNKEKIISDICQMKK